MKIYKTRTGPFTERPFYEAAEVERMCDEELKSVGLFPSEPNPIRIDRFIEKRFKISPRFYDLDEGVLGYIEFGQDGVKGIVISKSLSEDESKVAERRLNTTLAHEAGHGLLHTHLFVLGTKPESLFGKDFDPNSPKILCRNDSVQGIKGFKESTYNGSWWEYQANLAIGPLLLPQSLVVTSLEPYLIKKGLLGTQILDRKFQDDAIRILVETFDVNPIVAKIRLETLFPSALDSQLTL